MKRLFLVLAVLLAPSLVLPAPSPERGSNTSRYQYRAIDRFVRTAPIADREADAFRVWIGPQLRSDPTVQLDLNNAPVRDAIKEIMDQARQEYLIDADVPSEARVTVRAQNVKLSTALDLVTQAAGVRWAPQRQGSKTVIRIGKTVTPWRTLPGLSLGADGITLFTPDGSRILEDVTRRVPYRFQFSTRSSTFTCPHCKGQATVVTPRQQPRCPKCERTFQDAWEFCPFDGTKRPPSPNAWRYCPLCGKQVETEKTDATPRRGV